MSKIGDLTGLLHGAHVMTANGLADYHAARAVMNASRKRDFAEKFNAVRTALKNYRVMVSRDGQGMIRIYRPDTQAKFWIPERTQS